MAKARGLYGNCLSTTISLGVEDRSVTLSTILYKQDISGNFALALSMYAASVIVIVSVHVSMCEELV